MSTTNTVFISTSRIIKPIQDGKTRLYLEIPKSSNMSNLAIPLYWNQDISEGVIVDWGDKSDPFTVSDTGNVNAPTPHTYEKGGSYTITMTRVGNCNIKLGRGESGTGLLGDSSITANAVRMVLAGLETGEGVTTIQSYCFCRHAGIRTVYLGPDITKISNNSFSYAWHIGDIHFLGTLPANSNLGATNVWAEIPYWCKIYVPATYIDSNGNPQNIPSRMPSTSTYAYDVEPNAEV